MDIRAGSKIASVAVALVATWSTASADVVTVEFTPSTTVDHFRVFTQQQITNESTTVLEHQSFSEDFGSVVGGQTVTKSVVIDFEALSNADAIVGLVGSVGDSLLIGTGSLTPGSSFATNYGSTVPEEDITQAQAYGLVASGDAALGSRLFPKDNNEKGLLIGKDFAPSKTGNLLLFDATTGVSTSLGTWTASVQAVPEPATMAALGLGAAALLRRRRR